jgi:hypothetical protein
MEAEEKLKAKKERFTNNVNLLISIPVAVCAAVYGFRSFGSVDFGRLVEIVLFIAVVAGCVGGGIGSFIGGGILGAVGVIALGVMEDAFTFSDFSHIIASIIMFVILAAGGAIVGGLSGLIVGLVTRSIGVICAGIIHGKRILDTEVLQLLNPKQTGSDNGDHTKKTGPENGDYPEQADLLNGNYSDVAKRAGSWATGQVKPKEDELAILAEALWRWGSTCDQGSETYPKDEAKALALYKGAAWWGNTDAQEKLKQRGVPVRVRRKKDSGGLAWIIVIATGLGFAFLVSELLAINSFLLRWLVNLAAFGVGTAVPYDFFYTVKEPAYYKNFSVEPLQLVPPPPPKRSKANVVFLALWLAAAIMGWAGSALGFVGINIYDYLRKEQAAKPADIDIDFDLDVTAENGAAKIFRIHYGEQETVISIIRTTSSHKEVSIAQPGQANSFYVKDTLTGETWPLKEVRPQDYEDAAGVELVFDPFKSRIFDLVEGNDTSAGAWHFKIGVGAPSPGGGYVFYDKGEYSGGWRYLEAAPSSAEFEASWNDAVRKAEELKTGGFTGWRLPTMDELDIIYENLRLKGMGEFSGGYWSSNEGGNFKNSVRILYFWDNKQPYESSKKKKNMVRTVRQF